MTDTTLDPRFSHPAAKAASWDQTRQVLEDAQLSWICTVRADGRPHLTPLVAVWLDETLYFCTGADEQKAVNLRGNPHVLLLTGCSRWDEGLDVVAEGDAVRVDRRGPAHPARAGLGAEMGRAVAVAGARRPLRAPRRRPGAGLRGPPGQGPRVRQGTVRPDPAPPGLVPWPAGGLMDTLLPGISAERVPTSRLTAAISPEASAR